MKRLSRVVTLAAALVLAACATAPQPAPRRPLIMISIDGFRADYIGRGYTPTLARLAAQGVNARAMRPSFPALTYPNHYTLVTGLRPDHHGIVHNVIEDPSWPVTFGLGDRPQVRNPRWWEQGEPIWVTAKRAGRRTVSLFWPGDETPIHGLQPDRWKTFDQDITAEARADQMLAWIAADRPDFAGLYFDDVDSAGHTYGPDSPELNAAIARVDSAIARLLAGLAATGITEDRFDLIVTADHGMVRADKLVFLDDLAKGTARVVTGGATGMLEPLPERQEEAYTVIVGRHEHAECWRKQDVPERFHYGTNRRISAIVCLADLGWYLTTHAASDGKTPSIGQHGADPYASEMAALFIGHGPSFRQGVVLSEMDNVDIYPIAMRLLAVPPRPNDGNPAIADAALRTP